MEPELGRPVQLPAPRVPADFPTMVPPLPPPPPSCLGCGQPVFGEFCSHCGRRTNQGAFPVPGPRRGPHPLLYVVLAVALAGLGAGLVVVVHWVSRSDRAQLSAAPVQRTPIPSSFADVYQRVSSGVIRIDVTNCDGGGTGSGMLIAPDLVATVNHVTEDATSLSFSSAAGRTTGRVIGSDRSRDLSLVRLDRPLAGHVFTLNPVEPKVGDKVAALGYPLGEPLTLTTGTVSGLNRSEEINGYQRTGLVQTDTALNPGNSGGPLLTEQGLVAGLVDAGRTDAAGISWAVSATTAAPLLNGWRAVPDTAPVADCSDSPAIGEPATPNLPPGPASAPGALLTAHVISNGGPVNVRPAPSTSSGSLALADYGSAVTVLCQTVGETVSGPYGGTSASWDLVSYRGTVGFVADAFLDTGVVDQSC